MRTSPFTPPSTRPSPLSNLPGKGRVSLKNRHHQCTSPPYSPRLMPFLEHPLAWYILLRRWAHLQQPWDSIPCPFLKEFSSFPPTSSPTASSRVTLTSVSSDLGVPSSQRKQRAPPHPLSFSESLLTQTSFRLHSRLESSTESSSVPCAAPIPTSVSSGPLQLRLTHHPPRASLYLQPTIHRFFHLITLDLHLPG